MKVEDVYEAVKPYFKRRIEEVSEEDIKKVLEISYNAEMPKLFAAPYFGEEEIVSYDTDEIVGKCMIGDTLIDVPRNLVKYPDGIPIKDLVGKDGYVYTFDTEKDRFTLKKYNSVRKTRQNVEVWKLLYRATKADNNGEAKRILIATPDHKVLLLNGVWTELKDLKPRDRLREFRRRISSSINMDKKEYNESSFIMNEIFNKGNKKAAHHVNFNSIDHSIENLQILGHSEHTKLHQVFSYGYDDLFSKELLEQLYLNEHKSIYRLSDMFQCDASTIESYLKKYGIVKRPYNVAVRNSQRGGESLLERDKKRIRKPLGGYGASVIKVEPYGTQDVYNMEVENTQNFVSNSIVLHNCPWTTLLDYYRAIITYVPDKYVCELKSLKFYYLAYEQLPITHELLLSKIYKEFQEQIKPKQLKVVLEVAVRGGIKTVVEKGKVEMKNLNLYKETK